VLHCDVATASLGKRINDDARAKLIVDRYPREMSAIRTDNRAIARQMAKHVAELFVRGTPGSCAYSAPRCAATRHT
jgi:DNA-binding LacI/PurR family transcriptional regulator